MNPCHEIRELLELSALEPGGIERLEAGDSADAARVAAHVAGCAPCAEELVRLRRVVVVLRAALAEAPSPALRERTLSLVRATGTDRGPAVAAHVTEPGPVTLLPRAAPARPARRRSLPAWLAAAAVLALVAFGVGYGLRGTLGSGSSASVDPALATVAAAHARIVAAPDALELALSDPAGTVRGMLAAAPSRGEMLVMATGLPPAPAGSEYRCWIEIDGNRSALGPLWLDDDVTWWAGEVALPATIPPGTTFGVSLASGDSAGQPVLVGSN